MKWFGCGQTTFTFKEAAALIHDMSPMHIALVEVQFFNVATRHISSWSAPNRSLKTVVYGLGRLKHRACRRSIIFNYGQEIISVT
jgi:hypothetical protein